MLSASARSGRVYHGFLLRGLRTDRNAALLPACPPRPVRSVHKLGDRDGGEIPAAFLTSGAHTPGRGRGHCAPVNPLAGPLCPRSGPGPLSKHRHPISAHATGSRASPVATYFCIHIQPHKSYCIVSRNRNLCLLSHQRTAPPTPQISLREGRSRREGNS